MRTFIPGEYNHQDIDPHFLNSNINSTSHPQFNMKSDCKSKSESNLKSESHSTPSSASLETNDFLLPLIFLCLLYTSPSPRDA